MHQILCCSLLTVERWKIGYCTGHFIFTEFLRYNCWEIFFVKLTSFFEDHSVFWPYLSFPMREPPLRGVFGLRHKVLLSHQSVLAGGLLKGGGQESDAPVLPQLTLVSRTEQSPSSGFFPFCHFYGCCPFQYHLWIGSANRIRTGMWLEWPGALFPSLGMVTAAHLQHDHQPQRCAGPRLPPSWPYRSQWVKAKNCHVRSSKYYWAGTQLTTSLCLPPPAPLKIYFRK